MGVKIIGRQYNEIFTDGDTDWLLGNVGDWQKLLVTVEVAIEFRATAGQPISIDYLNNAFILTTGQGWGQQGFDNGMVAVLKYRLEEDTNNDGNFNFTTEVQRQYNITNIYGNTMEVLQTIDVEGFDLIPTNFGNKKIVDVQIFVDQDPEGTRMNYGHVTNANYQASNLNSFIDQSITEFVYPQINIVTLNQWVDMEPTGLQSGMSIRNIRVRKTGTVGIVRTYEFQIEFMISSMFESIVNFDPVEMPSYLEGDGSITDNFIIEFFPEWNNPNVFLKNDLRQTSRLGNTGWFNENFNQLNNDFEIESLEYFDENGNPVDSLDFSSKTKVKAVIIGVPNVSAATECGFGFAWVPLEEGDFQNKTTPFYRNVYTQSGSLDDGFDVGTLYPDTLFGAGLNGGSMDVDSVKFTELNGKIIFECNFVPNAAFFSAFDAKDENDRNYILWISVADRTLIRNFSDRVSLLADFNQMTKNIPPVGEYPYIDNAFLEHPELDDGIGDAVFQAITQDDFLCRLPFRIPKDGSIKLTTMTFGVHAFNPGLNRTFVLEKYDVDLTAFPDDTNGIPQYAFDNIRGFKLEPGNNKNWVKIQRESDLDTDDFHGHIAYFATKIRWEDWLVNIDAPSDFYDELKDNNGLHHDWIDYLRTSGWIINFFTQFIAVVDGELGQFENKWKFNFNDYDENVNVATQHEYYRDSDNTLINVGTDPDTGKPLGVILLNEPTRIEIRFEILDAGTWDLGTTYGVTTIEIDKGAGEIEMRQLSSVWGSEADNPLKPVTGETKLKLTVDGTFKFLTTFCLVDPDLLQDGARYRITGRVGCIPQDGGGVFDPGLYEFRYEIVYE